MLPNANSSDNHMLQYTHLPAFHSPRLIFQPFSHPYSIIRFRLVMPPLYQLHLIPLLLSLPNTKPPLNPPSPDTILANVISRILNIFLAPLFSFTDPLRPILPPLVNLIFLLQPLLLNDLCLVHHVHLVDFAEAPHRLPWVAEVLFARGEELGVYGLGHHVHVPACDREGDQDALSRR